MRLKPEIKAFIKETATRLFPDSDIYLFGSRTDENKRGGDIDILLLSENKIENKVLRHFRLDFYKKFGWQIIDLDNLTTRDNSTFKKLILPNAQAL
jgi:predicted nucleotidyltransferase